MDPIFLQTLEDLHDANEYQEIIDIIEALPKYAQTPELIGLLARAYCNIAEYDHALELLFSVRDSEDFVWNFRVGFAYYFSHRPSQAQPYFEQAFLHNPTPEIADYIKRCRSAEFINKTRSAIHATKENPTYNTLKANEETCDAPIEPPVLNDPLPLEEVPISHDNGAIINYLPHDLSAVQAHIEQYFGEIATILPFTSERTQDIRLCICPPNATNNYYTISTLGMGALPMNIPEEYRTQIPARLELTMTLPSDWEFDLSDNRWAWPLRWLLITAYLPLDENTWLDYGHSLSASADDTSFDPSTKQSCILVVNLQDRAEDASHCTLPDGEIVRFLQILPIYPEELKYKTQYGATALLRHMSNTGHIVCPYRLNTCTPDLLYSRINPSPYLC